MNKLFKSIVLIGFGSLVVTSCKKEETPPTVNNYYTSNDDGSLNGKPLLEYGSTDSTSKLTFSYYNGEAEKMEELISYSGSTPSAKLVVSYNASGIPTGYQSLSLPANTVNAEGTFSVDGNGNITQVLNLDNLGDTIGIITYGYLYVAGTYKIASKTYYSHSSGVNEYFDYFDYDNKGYRI